MGSEEEKEGTRGLLVRERAWGTGCNELEAPSKMADSPRFVTRGINVSVLIN